MSERVTHGTTLRSIMEWCGRNGMYVTACRKSASRTVRIDFDGDMSVDGLLCAADVYEADDWQAMLDGTTTWFVPGQEEPSEPAQKLPYTTRFASEAMAHGETGGVVGYRMLLIRLRDGHWELRAAYGEDTWDRPVRGEWEWAMGTEYILYPADHMDDSTKLEPREGPDLWAWMCRTGRYVISRNGVAHKINKGGLRFLPEGPCVPADGHGWDDEVYQ